MFKYLYHQQSLHRSRGIQRRFADCERMQKDLHINHIFVNGLSGQGHRNTTPQRY